MISGEGSILLRGEGGALRSGGTCLTFDPGANMLSGCIKIRNHNGGLEYMKINTAGSGVTRLIQIYGNGQHGTINHCYIDGVSGGGPAVSGVVGLEFDSSVAAVYYWKIHDNSFNKLDTGILINTGGNSNAEFIHDNAFDNTTVAIDVYGTLNMISNIYHQGHSTDRSGGTTIRFGVGAFVNRATNIVAEMFSGDGRAVIRFMSGVNNNAAELIANGQPGTIVIDENVSGANKYNRASPARFEEGPVLLSGAANPFDYYNDTGKLQQVIVGGGSGTVLGVTLFTSSTGFNTSGTQGTYMIHPGQIIRVAYSGVPRIYRQDG